MNNNGYIIPANSKKSMMILGLFTPVDLAIFSIGCLVTVIMLMVMRNANFGQMLLILAPALIASFLVAPIPNYHNVYTVLKETVEFFYKRRNYKWEGWCTRDEFK